MRIRTHDRARRLVFTCLSTALGVVLTTVAVAADDAAQQRDQRYLAAPLVELSSDVEADADEDYSVAWGFSALLPSARSRFFRSLDLQFSFLDQGNRVFVGPDMSDPPMPVFVPNPQDDLTKFEIKVQPGRWFRSAMDLSQTYALFKDKAGKAFVSAGCDPERPWDCDPLSDVRDPQKLMELAWAKCHGLGRRFARAISFTFGVSERSAFIGAFQLPAETLERDETELVWSVRFDADALLVFPEEVADAYAALSQHVGLSKHNRAGLQEHPRRFCDDQRPVECLRMLSDIKLRGRWLAALLPTIEVQSVDQFDFVAASNLVFESLADDSLETVTVTWDLSKALDSAKHRREAIKAIGLHYTLTDRERRFDQPLAVRTSSLRIPRGFPSPIQLQVRYTDPEMKNAAPLDVEWKGTELPQGVKLSKKGLLEAWDAPLGRWTFKARAEDDVGNETPETPIEIEVF